MTVRQHRLLDSGPYTGSALDAVYIHGSAISLYEPLLGAGFLGASYTFDEFLALGWTDDGSFADAVAYYDPPHFRVYGNRVKRVELLVAPSASAAALRLVDQLYRDAKVRLSATLNILVRDGTTWWAYIGHPGLAALLDRDQFPECAARDALVGYSRLPAPGDLDFPVSPTRSVCAWSLLSPSREGDPLRLFGDALSPAAFPHRLYAAMLDAAPVADSGGFASDSGSGLEVYLRDALTRWLVSPAAGNGLGRHVVITVYGDGVWRAQVALEPTDDIAQYAQYGHTVLLWGDGDSPRYLARRRASELGAYMRRYLNRFPQQMTWDAAYITSSEGVL